MFCSECGAKNEDGAKFCESCGASLEIEENTVQKTSSTSSKPKEKTKTKGFPKKYKGLAIVCVIVLVVLFGSYKTLESKTSPVAVAEDYIKAIESKDYKKLYELSGFTGDTTFMNEEEFKKVIDEKFEETPFSNYTINKTPTYTNNDLKAVVSVSFAGTSNGASDASVALTKEKGKKFLIFDNWKVEDTSYLLGYKVIKEYGIMAPKGSKVKFNGIELTDKYITQDKEYEEADGDVYILPQVFTTEKANVEVVTPYGINKTEEIKVSEYKNGYSVEFDKDDISDEFKNKIKENLQAKLLELETGIINGKSFDEQKNLFSTQMDTEYLKENYETISKGVKASLYKDSDFSITDLKLTDIYFTDDYTLEFSCTVNYKSKRTYTTTGEVKDINEGWHTSGCLNYEDNDFKFYKISNLYFSYWW